MKLLITLLFVLSISELHAQTFEISAQANGGFSHMPVNQQLTILF